MAEPVRVEPRSFEGTNLTLLFWKVGPRFTIGCGGCPATFTTRVPYVDLPTVKCPECGAWNALPLTTGRSDG